MIQKSYRIDGSEGSSLHVRSWHPEKTSLGVIQLLHGMAEHCERYGGFAEYMVEQGYVVYAHDHRKHGRSLKRGQDIGIFDKQDQFKNILKDVFIVQKFIRSQEADADIILMGHSMGSLIARRFLQEYGENVSKGIIMGTMYGNPVTLLLGRLVGNIVGLIHKKGMRSLLMDRLAVGGYNKKFEPSRTLCDWLSKDERQVDKYLADEMCGYSYSPNFYTRLSREIVVSQQKHNILKTPKVPILFISGTADPVGDFSVGVTKIFELYKRLGYEKYIELKLFDNDRHELLNETDKEEVYHFIAQWIKTSK